MLFSNEALFKCSVTWSQIKAIHVLYNINVFFFLQL